MNHQVALVVNLVFAHIEREHEVRPYIHMKFFITGATGFIGSHLCHRLVQEGHEVSVLVRSKKKLGRLPQNISLFEGDLSFFKKEQKIPEHDVFVHLAGTITANKTSDYNRINYECVVDIVNFLHHQDWKPRQFLFASSLAACGPNRSKKPLDETDPCQPIDPYGRSKLKAEHFLEKNTRFPTTTFRPCAVLGEGDEASLTLFKMASKGFGFGVWKHELHFSFINVHDLVQALVAMAHDKRKGSKIYFVSHPKPTSDRELWKLMESIFHNKIHVMAFPKFILFALMVAGSALSRVFPFFKNQLDIKQYKQITAPSFVCSSNALQKDLGWTPQFDLQITLQKAYEGYKKLGWI